MEIGFSNSFSYFYLSSIIISLVEQNTTAGSIVESTKKCCSVFNRRTKSGDSIFESGDKILNKGGYITNIHTM